MITVRQLEIFVGVVRHGSFRRCAEQLGISQVVVSEHIRALEQRLNRPLFNRQAGGPATLTEAGKIAERRAISILAEIGDFISEVAGDRTRRVVTVAAHPFLMRNVQEALSELKAAHPNIELRLDLEHRPIPELLELLERRDIDIAVFMALDDRDSPQSEAVRDERLAIFVGPDHPLARRSIVWSSDLRDTPYICLTQRRPLRIEIERALDAVKAGGGKIALETDEFGLLLSSVHRNLGFVCMFEATELEEGQTFGLKKVALQEPLPSMQVRVATRPAGRQDLYLQKIKAIFASAGV